MNKYHDQTKLSKTLWSLQGLGLGNIARMHGMSERQPLGDPTVTGRLIFTAPSPRVRTPISIWPSDT